MKEKRNDSPTISMGFTNKNGVVYDNILNVDFTECGLCGNVGTLVNQSKEGGIMGVPSSFDIENNGFYIYQSYETPSVARRIYKEFADWKFNGYSDDKLISELQKRQKNVSLTEFPMGVITNNGYIIGQEVPYYYDYTTLSHVILNSENKNDLIILYHKVLNILQELLKCGISYSDVHFNNFMVNDSLDVKLIDFENGRVGFDNMFQEKAMFENLKLMINIINQRLGINYDYKDTYNFDNAHEQIDEIEKVLKR